MPNEKTIMFLGAHADDMELRAAGTLAKYMAKGYRGVSVMLTNNLCGASVTGRKEDYFVLGPRETMEVRHREARAAAEILGVTLEFLDFKENSYVRDGKRVFFGEPAYDDPDLPGRPPLVAAQYLESSIRDVADVLVKYAPEIVATHSIANGNPEHGAAAHLVHSAFRLAAREVALGELWFTARRQSSGDVLLLAPDVLIDITDWMEIKLRAMACHKSQYLDTEPQRERALRQCAWWGGVAGVTYAEPFKRVASARHT
ncbi:MAG: PIG-L family deacetylase [Kiritimatiellae bacterium]|nr:PIG-L family deacetylase [Kiritimatiellia bacterium]